MKITASEISKHSFEKSFRGYDIEEVTIFLSNLSLEWDRLLQENKMQKMQLEIAEKETSKLKEVETTLIKTLKTAELTSSKIIDEATQEAEKLTADHKIEANRLIQEAEEYRNKTIEQANLEAEKILADAKQEATETVKEAEQKKSEINITAKNEYKELETNYSNLEKSRDSIVDRLKSIFTKGIKLTENIDNIEFIEPTISLLDEEVAVEPVDTQIEEPTEVIEPTNPQLDEEAQPEVNAFAETIPEELEAEPTEETKPITNKVEEEKPVEEAVIPVVEEPTQEFDNLEVIEGIGPKINEVLNKNGISSYKDICTTPAYKIKELLEKAGPHFSMHDPSSWAEQAKLALNENWDELDTLKEKLIAGKKPSPEVDKTEEMIDKVNKVKAAIRKSMVDKNNNADGESFFDNFK